MPVTLSIRRTAGDHTYPAASFDPKPAGENVAVPASHADILLQGNPMRNDECHRLTRGRVPVAMLLTGAGGLAYAVGDLSSSPRACSQVL